MSACNDDHCMTCADEGVEMRVLERGAEGVSVCATEDGNRADVMTELVGAVEDGDLVLVHAGVAIARLRRA